MKIAVCFLTTKSNHFNLEKLKIEVSKTTRHKIDIYEYINREDYIYDIRNNKNNTVYFKYDYLREKLRYNHNYSDSTHILNNNMGVQFLSFLDMYYNHKNEYDYYMFYEDDLSYFGEKSLFDKIPFYGDVFFQDERILVSDDNWFWYYNSTNKFSDEIKNIYHGLNNIYGCNNKVLSNFLKFIKNNFGYDEMLLATYVLNNDYKIYYLNKNLKLWCSYKDEAPISKEYNLIHPIKTLDKYSQIKYLDFKF